jgi:cell division inhibitor SepF
MAGFFKKALDYLGLEDDEYQDYDPYEDQPPVARRGGAPAPAEPEPAPSMVYPRNSTGPSSQGSVGPVTSLQPGTSGHSGMQSPSPESGVSGVIAQPRSSSSAVRTVTAAKAVKVHVTAPVSFGEAQDIGERFRTGQPVIIDLRETDRESAKRLIDFSSGLAFALKGDIKKVQDRVFLLRPNGVDVPNDEQRRLRDAGLMR